METPTLLFESLQLPSRVAHVCVGSFTAPEPQLLACKADHLELFQLQEDGALGAGRRYPLHKQIEACTCLPPVEGALQQVLLVADDGQARVCAFRDGRLQQLSSVSLDAPPGKASSAPSRRLQGACLSQPVPLPAGGFAVVAALFHRHLHVLRVSAGGRQISARCANLSTTGGSLSLDDLDSAGLMSNQETLHIQALEFLDAGSPGGSSGSGGVSSHTRLLAVLSVHDFSPLSRDTVVDTVALNLSTLVLTTGPWCCRQMHPTTGALRALPAGSALGAGKGPAVLAFSGCGVTAVVTPQPSAASLVHGQGGGGGGGASAPQADCVRLLSHRLRGSPTCVEQLRPDVYVVGTDGAALYLVGLAVDSSSSQEMPPPAGEQQQQQQAWVQELALSGGAQPSVPSSLALLPAPPSAAAAAGVGALLAIGSTDGNSLLVAVPPALQADAAGAQPFVTAQVARDNSTWEVVEPSFVKNFAPVHSVAALPDK